jgi:hypothetical protein
VRPLPIAATLAAIALIAIDPASAQTCCGGWQYQPQYYIVPYQYEPCNTGWYEYTPCAPKAVSQAYTTGQTSTTSTPKYSAFTSASGALYGVNSFTGQVYQYNEATKDWEPLKAIP